MGKLIVIIGHSGSGKTELALKLAKEFELNILSADSRQIYKNLEYSTNKLPMKGKWEKKNGFWIVDGIKYYGYDVLDWNKEFSPYDFCTLADKWLKKDKKIGIIAGGTGMYIKALLDGENMQKVKVNKKLRIKLNKLSLKVIHKKLNKLGIDTQKLNNSEKNNKQRLIRKLEISLEQHKIGTIPIRDGPFIGAELREKMKNVIVIKLENPDYREKVKIWTEKNFEKIEQEIRELLTGCPTSPLFSGFIFTEMRDYLLGNLTKEQTKSKIYFEYIHYIKRQKTYFKKYFPQAICFDNNKKAFDYVKKIIK